MAPDTADEARRGANVPAHPQALEAPIWPGVPTPLGAHFDGAGTNFAVYSPTATSVRLCLIDANGVERRVALPATTYHVWHGYLPGVGPGQRYGFRVDGRDDPAQGVRHNAAKLLVDPYARRIDGALRADAATAGDNATDSAPFVPHAVVSLGEFDWSGDAHPGTPWSDTVIYELHVTGFTRQHPDIPPALRGTYLGLTHPAAIDYLTDLGVTAIELLPVHHFVSEPRLQAAGRVNYWGYNTLGYFAPHAGYAARPGDQVAEFKAMVRALHRAGLEVILDVVFNHTAEGGLDGPMLSLRGLDNLGYYRLAPGGGYVDYTGCGNTVDVRGTFTLQLITDALRYWVTEMHVDGFRFDLAPVLGRGSPDFDPTATLFTVLHQDPLLSRVKLIAEPWDLGPGGYQVGNFPALWAEWNGRFRDTVRTFYTTGDGGIRDLAYRLTGSSDLYDRDGRLPFASINFVTAHDGFTLRDLVSYQHKHNEANGEGNQDGTDDNRSVNCGVEGDPAPAEVTARRQQLARTIMSTLLLSTGVPMITAGDERWRTQAGNNNAYVQDNATSWVDWTPSAEAQDMLAFTRTLLRLRRAHPVLRQPGFFEGQPIPGGDGRKDLAWFHPAGRELGDADWFDPGLRTIGVYLDGQGLRHHGPRGEVLVDDSFLWLINSGDEVKFGLPGAPWAGEYEVLLDTSRGGEEQLASYPAGGAYPLAAQSAVLARVRIQ